MFSYSKSNHNDVTFSDDYTRSDRIQNKFPIKKHFTMRVDVELVLYLDRMSLWLNIGCVMLTYIKSDQSQR